jgi:hypothetical protein
VRGRESLRDVRVLLGPCKLALAATDDQLAHGDVRRLAPFQTDLATDFSIEFVASPPSACAGLQRDSSRFSGDILALRYSGWFAEFDKANRRGRVFAPSAELVGDFLRTAAQILPLLTHTGVALHAACLSVDGVAVALAAPAGTGKTTAAMRILGPGVMLIAEDLTLVGGLDEARPDVRGAQVQGSDGSHPGPKATPLARIYGLRRAAVDSVVALRSRDAMAVLRQNIAIGTRQPQLVFEALRCARILLGATPVRRLDCTLDGPVCEAIRRDLADGPNDATEVTWVSR